MADFPALPLFTDAYLSDTRHLSTEEHGAYLLLLMEAWRRPDCSLPDDDRLLARLAGLPIDRWEQVKLVILEFWKRDGRRKTWTQKRLLKERAFVAKNSKSQSDKAAKRWNKTKKNDAAALPEPCRDDAPTPTPTPSSSLRSEEEGGGGGSACARDADPPVPRQDLTEREQMLEAMGIGRDGIAGPSAFVGGQGDMAEARRWLALPGLSLPVILEEIRRVSAAKQDGPPKSFRYFTPAMQRLSAQMSAPPLAPTPGARASPQDQAQRQPVQFDLSKFDDYGNRIA